MGRKANWFRAVKQALGSECKDHQDQRPTKSKKKWFVKKKKKKSSPPIPNPSTATDNTTTTAAPATTPAAAPPVEAIKQLPAIPSEEVKLKEEEEEDEQKKHAQSIAIATAKAAEAAAAAAQAAAEVVRLTNAAPFPGKPKEEVAALTIQTAFRGYLARRAFCALRGLASLKIVMQVQCIKHPTTNTLKSMQSLVRVQSQVRNRRLRRLRMPEDNQVRMGLTLEKQVKELEKVENLQQNGNDWNASPKSKEQMEARLQSQHEAAIRRERALAYSLNHEKTRRSSPASKSARTIFMDMKSGHSGWSWLERWLAARPWETANSPDLGGAQMVSEKQTPSPRSLNTPAQKGRTSTGRLSTSTPSSKARLSSAKPEHTSPKASPRRSLCCAQEEEEEEEAKSVVSGQSGSSESVAASSLPSYMVPTESARAKASKHEAADRLSVCSAKKRASSPARSRRSASSITDANSIAEQQSFINAM